MGRIFPLIFILVGASVGFFGFRGLIRAKASVNWPMVEGKIVESTVDRSTSNSNGSSSTTYQAAVLYDYSVDGTLFSSDCVAYGDYGTSSPSHARDIVNRYPKDKVVTVRYMPGNPEESLLEPGIQGQSWFLPAFGLIFFTVGIVMAIILPNVIRRQGITNLGTDDSVVYMS